VDGRDRPAGLTLHSRLRGGSRLRVGSPSALLFRESPQFFNARARPATAAARRPTPLPIAPPPSLGGHPEVFAESRPDRSRILSLGQRLFRGAVPERPEDVVPYQGTSLCRAELVIDQNPELTHPHLGSMTSPTDRQTQRYRPRRKNLSPSTQELSVSRVRILA
jgi:hypothetical protein